MSYTTNPEETRIIEGCLANNAKAQKALYDRYKNAMYTLSYRITGDLDTANDVLQDAFVQVFRGLPKFRRESTLGAWVKTIVVRTAYRKNKQRMYFEPLEHAETQETIDWGTHSLDVEYLEKAIQELPTGYRSVFILVEVEGYKHKEVATMLDISVGTSKSQLFHAKKLLRKKLEGQIDRLPQGGRI